MKPLILFLMTATLAACTPDAAPAPQRPVPSVQPASVKTAPTKPTQKDCECPADLLKVIPR